MRVIHLEQFMKMDGNLVDLDEVIPDHTLVLNVLRYLSKRYRDIGIHLCRGHECGSQNLLICSLLLTMVLDGATNP
nr:unnamed protein product [Digitaria exilis]